MSSPDEQLEAIPDTVKQVFVFCAILQELFSTLLSLFRGNASLQDVHARVLALHADVSCTQDQKSDEVSASSPVGSKGSYTTSSSHTSDTSDESPCVSSGSRLLCRAIVEHDIEKASRILESRPTLVDKRHEGGWYPLHAAVLSEDIELVKKLLAYPRVDVNAKYECGCSFDTEDYERELGCNITDTDEATPLHYAAMVGNIDIIHLLVEHGASFKSKDHNDRKPIDYFKPEEQAEALESYKVLYDEWKKKDTFFRDYTHFDDLVRLMWKDKYDLFDRVIKRNPNRASAKACTSITLLHMAVMLQRQGFVESLIATKRSLVNKRDKRRPESGLFHGPGIHCCRPCESPQDSCIPLPPTIPYDHIRNATPLHYACLVKDMTIAGMLLEAGADWTAKDSQGRTPEELIQEDAESCDEIKSTFVRLRKAEEERRKLSDGGSQKARNPLPDDDSDSDSVDDEGKGTKSTSNLSVESLLGIEAKIGEKLVGQRGPIHMVANAIRLRAGGWIDPDRPLTMLFLGSSGVGKTELAKQLALYLNGKDGLSTDEGKNVTDLEKKYSFVRLDMSEYQERHTVHNLIGAPKSYVGYGDGGALTRPLKKNPRAVVLLDEIEKAHPDVLTTFLQVFDDGRVTDSKDGVIYCKDAIFIMTSNIAGDEIKRAAPRLRQTVEQCEKEGRYESYVHTMQDFTRTLYPQLKCHLKRDEFIGRINEIAVFLPLSYEEIQLVVQRELEMWCKRAQEKHKVNLTWTNGVVRRLAAAYNVDYGVRSVASEVQRIALRLVAEAHIKGKISENCTGELVLNRIGDVELSLPTGIADSEEPTGIGESGEPRGIEELEPTGIEELDEPVGIEESGEPRGIEEYEEPIGIEELSEPTRTENRIVIHHSACKAAKGDQFKSFVELCKQIVVVLPLSEEEVELAVQRELAVWCRRAKEKHGINLTWTNDVVQKLSSFYDADEGECSIADGVQRVALRLIAEARNKGRISANCTAELKLNGVGDIVMKFRPSRPEEDVIDVFSDFIWSFAED